MSGNFKETNAELESRNKRLMSEIDQLQTQLFNTQDQARMLQELLDEKKHSEQLAGWAVDRALQIKTATSSVGSIIADAEKFCAWVHESSAREKKRLITQDNLNHTQAEGNA